MSRLKVDLLELFLSKFLAAEIYLSEVGQQEAWAPLAFH